MKISRANILFKRVIDLHHILNIIFFPRHYWLVVRESHDQPAGVAIVVSCKVIWFSQQIIQQFSGLAILEGLVADGFGRHCHLMDELADSPPSVWKYQ